MNVEAAHGEVASGSAAEGGRASFARHSSASGGFNGARGVTSVDRACRLTITIDGVKNLKQRNLSSNLKDSSFKIIVEGKKRKSLQISGETDGHGVLPVNQSFAFDVRDVKRSTLIVKVYKNSRFGNKLLGQTKHMPISDLVKEEGKEFEVLGMILAYCTYSHPFKVLVSEELVNIKSEWHDLYSKDGEKLAPGQVLMKITAGVAKPEQKLHVFVGTWNVGNAQPDKDLSAWLTTETPCDIVAIGAQASSA